MTFIATCRASVYRGTTANGLGDQIDDNATPVIGFESLPASLIEKNRRVQDPTSGTWRTVRYCAGRFTPGIDIRRGDRIKDNRTGKLYAVDEETGVAHGLAGQSDLLLDLRIV